MRVKAAIIPPGGWHYIQNPGEHRIDGSDLETLVDNVLNWRLQNGVTVGNVAKDVEEFICTRWPNQCLRGSQNPMPSTAPHPSQTQRFVDAILKWATDFMDKKYECELPAEAMRRAEICSRCVRQERWDHACPRCTEHAGRLLAIIRRGKELPEHLRKKLRGCAAFQFDTRTAVWLPREELKRPSNAVPPECWNK